VQDLHNFLKSNNSESILKYGNIQTPNPKYSILIPTFDRELYLFDALDSIVYQQINCLFEVIIVDNCPDLNISLINKLSKYDPNIVFYYKNTSNIGMIENWNRAAFLARGEWITYLHDDDMFLPDYLKVMDFIISNNPHIKLLAPSVYFGENLVLDKLETPGLFGYIISSNILFFRNLIPTQGTMFSKKCFEEINGFDVSQYPISDYSLWFKLVHNNLGIKIDKKLVFYRIEDNESQKIETKLQIVIREYEQRLNYLKDTPSIIIKLFFLFFAKINYKLRLIEIINLNIDPNLLSKYLNYSKFKYNNPVGIYFLKFTNRLYMFCLRIYISYLRKIKYILE
jgi:glycosyltransferase involved in cell wall biosynthesis